MQFRMCIQFQKHESELAGNFGGSRGLSRQGGRKGPSRKESRIWGQESKGAGEPGVMDDIREWRRQSPPSSTC